MKRICIFILMSLSLASAGELSMAFTGNNRGLLAPCGCRVPSGGWARIGTILQKTDKLSISAGAGNHFFHHTPIPGEDQLFEQKKAAFQAEMFREFAYDVINIGQYDLCYGINVLRSLQSNFDLPFISANLRDLAGDPVFPPYKVVTKGELDIVFIGICSLSDGFNFTVADPLLTLQSLLDEGIQNEGDLVVLLADAPGRMLADFAKNTPGIDLIVCAKEAAITGLPVRHGETALTQLGSQGKYLGKLEISFTDDPAGWKDLSLYRLALNTAEKEAKASGLSNKKSRKQIQRHKNTLRAKEKNFPDHYMWELILLDGSVPDLPDIKKRVEGFTPYPDE